MSIGPFFNFNNTQRAELFDTEAMQNLNTYRNWGPFVAPIARVPVSEKEEEDEPVQNTSVKSLFNPVYSVGYNQFMQVRQNAPLLDTPENRLMERDRKDCSIKGLVEASKKNMLGRSVYSYADFMYCKHLGKLSNNYLVTLRRFAFPCGDHINYSNPYIHDEGYNETEKHAPDIGRLVTWMGTPGNDMSKILSWDVNLPFKEFKSGIEDVGDSGGDKKSPLGTFLNATTNSKFRDQMVKGYAGRGALEYISSLNNRQGSFFKYTGLKAIGGLAAAGGDPPYSGLLGAKDGNKIYGPLDVIASTHKRDVGLVFNQQIELVFDYELRSYDGINAKAAFLDLIGNILAVTYANGAFWGGAYRGSGASQSNVFANLPIWKLNGNSSFSDVVSSFVDSGHQILSSLGGNTGDPLQSIKNIISTIAKGAFSALLGAGLNALGRPEKHAASSLLSPMPVGFWHLTIGNPWNPIMTIGNLIMDSAKVEQYGPLGLDDFPSGLKLTVTLKHGKPRDSTQIEQMFLLGENRIYTPVDDEVLKMYEAADPIEAEKNKQLNKNIATIRNKYSKWAKNDGKDFPELHEKDPANSVNILKFMKLKTDELGNGLEDEYDLDVEGYGNAIITDFEKQRRMLSISKNFFQWFGTNDEETITTISREAAFGSKRSGTDVTGRMS